MQLNVNGGYFDLAPNDLAENCRRDVLELEAWLKLRQPP